MTILNCTPWDFAGFNMPRARYASSHAFGPGLPDWIRRNPADAYLIDAEDFDNQRNIDGLADVLTTFDTHAPGAKRVVYRSIFRCSDQAQENAKLDLAVSMADSEWETVNQFTDEWALDVYLMGVPIAPGTKVVINGKERTAANPSAFVDTAKTLDRLPEYLARNRRVGRVLAGHTAKPVIPCIHERYHEGHRMAPHCWQHPQVWRTFNQEVRARWPRAAWWSGSIQEPGLSRYFTPSEADMIPFAAIADEVFRA